MMRLFSLVVLVCVFLSCSKAPIFHKVHYIVITKNATQLNYQTETAVSANATQTNTNTSASFWKSETYSIPEGELLELFITVNHGTADFEASIFVDDVLFENKAQQLSKADELRLIRILQGQS